MASFRAALCVAAFLFIHAALPGQTPGACHHALSGVVIDDHDGGPLPYAEIFLPELGRGVVSDADGRYRIDGLCRGPLRVRVTHLGCEPVERRVDIRGDRVLDFHLEHHAEELRELEVVRARPDENVGMARTGSDAAELERQQGRGLAEMLANLPGMAVTATGPTIGKPVIHGLSGNRVLIMNQGIRQEDQQWGGEHAPLLDPLASDRITVVKGAASVQYGADAIGGVIIAERPELPRGAGVGGEVRLLGQLNGRGGGGLLRLQGGAAGKLRGLGWRVQATGRYLGDAASPTYSLSNTALREGDLNATVAWRRERGGVRVHYAQGQRELGIMRAAHIGSLTDLNNAIARQEPWYVRPFTYTIDAPRQQVRHHQLQAEGEWRTTPLDRLTLTYGYQANDRQEYDVRRGGRSARPALDLFLLTHTADLIHRHHLGRRLHGKVGANGLYQENYNIPGTGVRPLLPDHVRSSAGVFIHEHLPIGERIELEAGGRLETSHLRVFTFTADNAPLEREHRFVNHAYSLGGNVTLRDGTLLRSHLGSGFRPPHVSELYSEGLHHGAAAIEEGDASLRSERMHKLTVDVERAWWNGRIRTEATVHGSIAKDFIQLLPDGQRLTIRGAFPVFRYSATDARLWGLDATVLADLGHGWTFRSRWSMVRGRDTRNDQWLFQMPADRTENAIAWRGAGEGRWRAPEVELTGLYVFRQVRYPAGVDYMDPPGDYFLVGLQAGIVRPLGSGELRLGLLASNLLNTRYRDYLDRFRYYADARGIDVLVRIGYRFGRT